MQNGCVILEKAVPPSLVEKAALDLDCAYAGSFPDLKFECHAVVQMAIALGAAAGGWVFDASGYQATFSLSAGILLVAGLLALAAWLGIAKPSPLARQSAAH